MSSRSGILEEMPILEVHDLAKRLGSLLVVDGVSFSPERGESLGL